MKKKISKYKKIVFLFFVLLAYVMISTLCFADERIYNEDSYNILILNSYDSLNVWETAITGGLKEELSKLDVKFSYFVEFLDDRRYGTGDNELIFFEYLEKKYENTDIDFIVLNDDYALQFMIENRELLFDSEIPLFFAGVNQDIDINNPYVGVYETTDIINTLSLMSEIHGEDTKMYIVSDRSSVNKNVLAKSFYDLDIEESNVELILSNDFEYVKNKVKRIDDGVVLYIAFHKDIYENNYGFLDSYREIKAVTNVPIYSVWDIYLNDGIVGGYLTKGSEQGELVAEFIRKTMQGTPYRNLKSTKNRNHLIIDKKVAKDKNLDLSNVNDEIIFINNDRDTTMSYAERFNALITHVIITTIFIIIIINVLSRVYKYKRKLTKYINDIDEENKMNYELEKNVSILVEKNKNLRKEIEISRESIAKFHKRESYSYINKTIIDTHKEILKEEFVVNFLEMAKQETQYNKKWINIDDFVDDIKHLLETEFKNKKINVVVHGQNKEIFIEPGYLFEIFSDLARYPFSKEEKKCDEISFEIEVFNEELKLLISEIVCIRNDENVKKVNIDLNYNDQKSDKLTQEELVEELRKQLIPKIFNDYMRTKFYGMVNYSINRDGGQTCIIRIPIKIK